MKRPERGEAAAGGGPARSPLSLVSRLSHELRTPLNAVLGYAELVREELEESGQYPLARDVDRIHRAANDLALLIDKLVELATLENTPAPLRTEPVDVAALAAEVVEAFRPLAASRGNELVLDVADRPVFALADAGSVRRVLQELTDNAVRFTHDGRVTCRVRAEGPPSGPGVARRLPGICTIEVSDTGPGLPEHRQMALFDALHRDDERRPDEGAGLGLAISRALVRLMGGDIGARSAEGRGSTFTVRLPLAREGARPAEPG